MTGIIFVCKSYLKNDDGSISEYYTVVLIDEATANLDDEIPIARYYSFFSDKTNSPNLDIGLKYLGVYRK